MKKKVKLSKLDNATMVTRLVRPLAAMAAGESVPQLRMIKTIPDVVFVPSATVLALASLEKDLPRECGITVMNPHPPSPLAYR